MVGLSSSSIGAATRGHARLRRAAWPDKSGASLLCLSNATVNSYPTPVIVDNVPDAVVIRAGWQHACALRATGAVVCWGTFVSSWTGW
jgi:hypothetical protein